MLLQKVSFFKKFFCKYSNVKKPIPLTGKALNNVTPSPLKNVRNPSSLNFITATFFPDVYFGFYKQSDCKTVFT
jgi:hypothetical protein